MFRALAAVLPSPRSAACALLAAATVACGATPTPGPEVGTESDVTDTQAQFDAAPKDASAGTDAAAVDATADVADAKADVKDVAALDVAPKDTAGPDADAVADVPEKPDVVAKDTAVVDTAAPDVPAPDTGAADSAGEVADGGTGPTIAGCTTGLIWLDGACVASSAGLHAGDGDSTASNSVSLYIVPPNNLLTNGGGESGDLSGWTPTDGGDPWVVISGGAPFGGRYFRASYAWGYLAQTVDLTAAGISAADLDAGIPIHLGFFGIGWGFTSSAGKQDTIKLDVAFLDASDMQLGTWSSGELPLDIGVWGSASTDSTSYPTGTRKVKFTIGSIDGEYWKGNYAATVDGANVSVGALDIRISNGDGTWSAWQTFTSTVANWSLTPGPGQKTVQVEFRDATGKSLGVVTDTVVVQ